MRAVPHPIPYQGSKRLLARHILAHLPLNSARLIEPFAGSAAVSLAALADGRTTQVLLGDVDAGVMAVWQAVLEQPGVLATAYKALWQQQQGRERAFYDEVRARYNTTPAAADFLFLLVRCVKAAVRYNAQGEFNQSPDNRRKGTRPATMHAQLYAAHALLQGRTALHCGDYRALLAETTAGDVVYLDPPYQGVSSKRDNRYRAGVSVETLVGTLHELNARSIPFLLSYDGHTGSKHYGAPLPADLDLTCVPLVAGRSSQATLLGRNERTVESLYVSRALRARLQSEDNQIDQYDVLKHQADHANEPLAALVKRLLKSLG